MHRRPLLDLLARYRAVHPEEAEMIGRVEALVNAHEDCFLRSCLPGHITASAWIASADGKRALFTHHRKLDRWLQLGGHADGDPDVFAVALREAREESGMGAFERLPAGSALEIFDVDVHWIPPRKDEPGHEHHDIRFLLRAREAEALVVSDESVDLAWLDRASIEAMDFDESLRRLARKAWRVLGEDRD